MTNQRQMHLKRLADVYVSARAATKAAVAHEKRTRGALFEALSKQQQQVYAECLDWWKAHEMVESLKLSQSLKVSRQHATTLLKDLYDVGLLSRMPGESGEYLYWVNE